jgi:PAS domain S-box-containing protein
MFKMGHNTKKIKSVANSSLTRATFLLSAGLISAALIIGLISYQYSYQMMEKSYQDFYMNKAQMIVNAASGSINQSDSELLKALDLYWEAAQNRPADEYICVVNGKGNLLLHTGNPKTVGNYAGDNPVLGNQHVAGGRLCELVEAQQNYIGEYISSEGNDQIAAFVAMPQKKWMLGVHRSRNALERQISEGFRPMVVGFIAVCAVLMPGALLLLYFTYSRAQRRQLEATAALRESEQRYESLVETMPQCLYRTDIQGRMTFANRALLEAVGGSLDQCMGKMATDIFPPHAAGGQLAQDVEVIRSGKALGQIEQLNLPSFEQARFVEQVKSPVYNADGDIVGLQGIFWDVTDKKEAEEKLQHTMAQLETVLQSVPSGILAVNCSGIINLVNQKAEEILGIKASEAVGSHVTEFVPDSGLVKTISEGKAELGKPYTWENKTLIVSRSPIYDGAKIIGAVSIFHDQSEMESVQKQLDEMTRLKNEYTSLVENSHDGVLITDAVSVLKVNASFGRITGLAPLSLEGKPVADLDSHNHICLASVKEAFNYVLQQGSPITLRRELKNQNEIFVTGSPVKDKASKVVRVVMNFRDVTELESLEEKLKKISAVYLESTAAAGESPKAVQGIVAESPVTKGILDLSMRVAQVDSTVLLTGESGVGKDVLARLIHSLSKRHAQPFISVNCGAIPDNLLESEFFGYEKGAFSGADKEGKPGLFEEADKGTVFLDEVGELPLNLQVKLLKLIQESQCRRLGSVKNIDLDVRIIAATNRDLKKMMADGQFREDLFYRLYVVPIEIPPLRQRREDILPLAMQFLGAYNQKYGVTRTLGQEVLRVMENYDWPGNVRELQNVVERTVVTADSDVLEPRHLPKSVYTEKDSIKPLMQIPPGITLREAREILDRQMIEDALSRSKNTRDAARMLGVAHSTVVRQAQKFGLSPSDGTSLH